MTDKLQLGNHFCLQIKSHTITWHLRSKYFGSPINSVQPPLLCCFSQWRPLHQSPNRLSDFFFNLQDFFLGKERCISLEHPILQPQLLSSKSHLFFRAQLTHNWPGSLPCFPPCKGGLPCVVQRISLHVRGADTLESDRPGPEPYLCHDQL